MRPVRRRNRSAGVTTARTCCATCYRRLGLLTFIPLRGPDAPVQELRLVARRAGRLDATQSKVAEEMLTMLSRRWQD